jgi:hypothetical protein
VEQIFPVRGEKAAEFDRKLSLRLHQALTDDKDGLFQSVVDPSVEVLKAALRNPQLGEGHLLVLLKRRDLPEELFKTLCSLEAVTGSHKLRVELARHPKIPPYLLAQLLPLLHLFELLTVCYIPGIAPDQKFAAERAIIMRLPTAALGNKMTLARRGTSAVVEALLKEGELPLVEPCISNPRLKEAAVAQFLNGPKATAETISIVARHPRWGSRLNVRLSILRNPHTPLVWFVAFLPSLPAPELDKLLHSKRLVSAQKEAVREALAKRGHHPPRF